MATQMGTLGSGPIFGEARSGMIAHENQKRITTGTQFGVLFPIPQLALAGNH
jgi:hypothetical protein